jgi:S1-C subfamily serine protease
VSAVTHWVDVVIVAVLLLAALRGWRTGGIRQLASYGGILVGLVAGVVIVPVIDRHVAAAWSPVVAIVIVVAGAAIGGVIGGALGWHLSALARRIRLGRLDDALGVAVAVVAMSVVVWLVGTLAASSRSATVNRGLEESAILQDLTRAMPTVPAVFARIEADLAVRGVPIVFATLPPQLLPPVAQPGDATVRAAAAAAGPSTVKVIGPACGGVVEGSGFVAAPGIVVTNAHVVAGDADPRVQSGAGTYAATAIGFDPKLDVAVLRVPGLGAPALAIDTGNAGRGTMATALGYPDDGPLVAVPASVDGMFLATGLDISGSGLVSRSVYQLHAVIRPGNSGGPLVAERGSVPTVIGLVFARSTAERAVGYALAMAPVARDLQAAVRHDAAVRTGGCAG